MPKTKKRGGEKAHRKRVVARNLKLKSDMRKQSQLFKEAMMEQLEAIRNSTGNTENSEITTSELVNLKTDGFIQSDENI
jgi:hypothetical protein